MEVTLAQSKSLHCPFGRQHLSTSTDTACANRWKTTLGHPQFTKCLGNQCMLWVPLDRDTDSPNSFGKCGAI